MTQRRILVIGAVAAMVPAVLVSAPELFTNYVHVGEARAEIGQDVYAGVEVGDKHGAHIEAECRPSAERDRCRSRHIVR